MSAATFGPRVHDGYIFGSDTAFSHFKPSISDPDDCRATAFPPTQIYPPTSTVSRSAEVRYFDAVAQLVHIALEEDAKLSASSSSPSSFSSDDFREIVLLTDINVDSGSTHYQHNAAAAAAAASSGAGAGGGSGSGGANRHHHHHHNSNDQRMPWRGTICVMQTGQDGMRYFIPATHLAGAGSKTISLYHYSMDAQSWGGLKEYTQLYAGRVCGIVGAVVKRNQNSTEITAVNVNKVVYPKPPSPATGSRSFSSGTLKQHPRQQRIHFVPLPVYNDTQSEAFSLFLTDVIHYLGSPTTRSSSLIVFCGAVAPDPKASEQCKSSFDRMAVNMILQAQARSEEQQQQQQQQQYRRSAVPIAFVPHVDDITMTPPMVPQSGASALCIGRHDYTATVKAIAEARAREDEEDEDEDEDDAADASKTKTKENTASGSASASVSVEAQQQAKNKLGVATHLAGNPGELLLASGSLRVVATSIDIISALASHSITSAQSTANASRGSAGGGSAWRLAMAGSTVRESMLLVPYINGCDEYAVEPSALGELARGATGSNAPHIYFTPSSVGGGAHASFVHGTLFLSCATTTAASLRLAGATGGSNSVGLGTQSKDKFQVLEVDVADAELFSKETVRVKVIEFIRAAALE